MKLKLLFPIFILCCFHAFGQKEYNVWYFGEKAGINFNFSSPYAVFNGQLMSEESSSGICDVNGDLLFYTNGDTIWNKNHTHMMDGVSFSYYGHQSGVQGSIVVKKPETREQYYIFSPGASELPFGNMRYWLVDMSLDGGNGEVLVKNQDLGIRSLENIAITKHANGRDIWIGTRTVTNEFYCFRTENGNLGNPVISALPKVDHWAEGVIKFSPDGRLILSLFQYQVDTNAFYVHHFDKHSGKLKDSVKVDLGPDFLLVNAEFSSDSRFLYAAFVAGANKTGVIQYDLSEWNADSIVGSKIFVYQDSTVSRKVSGIQLGPDKKIYLFYTFTDFIGVIKSPNQKGALCDVHPYYIPLLGRRNSLGGPYFPTFSMRTFQISLSGNKILCENDSTVLKVKAPYETSFLWNTGDTSRTIVAKQAGWYKVTATQDDYSAIDSIEIKVGTKPKVYLGNDTAFCGKFSYILNAGKDKNRYQWSNGDTLFSILVDNPGVYSVTVKDSNSCEAGDTILIGQLMPPNVSVSYDSQNCKDIILNAPRKDNGINYLWNTGDTTESIIVSEKGIYTITASNQFCSIAQLVLVDKLPAPEIELGSDTSLCGSNSIILKCKDGDSYLWNTGDQADFIEVFKPGQYWVIARRNHCETTDTINVLQGCELSYFIPNAFSPTGDKINEVFKVKGQNIEWVIMQIFNRWGEKIYEEEGVDPAWNGMSSGSQLQQDVYVYSITIKGKKNGIAKTETVFGNITLLR